MGKRFHPGVEVSVAMQDRAGAMIAV